MALGVEEWQAMHDACAAARRRILEAAMHSLAPAQMMRAAEAIGLPPADELAQVPEDDLAFAIDLALHAAAPGRPRPIDQLLRRQARAARGEALLMLRAMETSWFSVFRVTGTHSDAGILFEDVMLGGEVWALDGVLEGHSEPGSIVAARLGRVQGFAMTSGVAAGLDEAMLAGLRQAVAASGLTPAEMMAEPRVATLAYRKAVGIGVQEMLGRR